MGEVLQESGFAVTVADVETLESVDGYDAYVLGSAIHAGMWLTAMSRFLDQFESQLALKPVYFWITCIRVLEPDGYQHALENYIHQETLDKIGVRESAVFAGKLRLDAIDLRDRWTLALRYDGAQTPGTLNDDFRDWDAIRAWTIHVRGELEKAIL